MNILGVGLPEILFILLLVVLIFGPKDLEKTGKILGKGLNKLIHSDFWRILQQTNREIRTLPTRLMRESGLDTVTPPKILGPEIKGPPYQNRKNQEKN